MKNAKPTKRCYHEGTLRAYLDDELSGPEHETLTAHLTTCFSCQEQLAELRTHAEQVALRLTPPEPRSDPRTMLQRVYQTAEERGVGQHAAASSHSLVIRYLMILITHLITQWRKTMSSWKHVWTNRYRLLAGVVALCAIALLLALPPVRAAANQLLQVFRVQKVMFVSISPERMEQLQNLDFDEQTLFVGEPEMLEEAGEPQTVATTAEAATLVGYAVHEPSTFPEPSTIVEIMVNDPQTAQFQVNVEASRELLALVGVNDVDLPDALGEQPIVTSIPASVLMRYEGASYDLSLYQSPGPDVSLPEGVDLPILGKAALRLLGMEPAQAEALSREIDWRSTLIFPIPPDIGEISQVTVGDNQGLLIDGEWKGERHGPGHGHGGPGAPAHQSDDDGDTRPHKVLYWHNADRIYVLIGTGAIRNQQLIEVAQSVR